MVYCDNKENKENRFLKDRLGPKLKISQLSESKASVAHFTDQTMPASKVEETLIDRTRSIEKPPIARVGSERPVHRNLILKHNIKLAVP